MSSARELSTKFSTAPDSSKTAGVREFGTYRGENQPLGIHSGYTIPKIVNDSPNDHHEMDSDDLLATSDTFQTRHIGPSPQDIEAMCRTIGVKSVTELIDQAIPPHLRRQHESKIHPGPMSETVSLQLFKGRIEQNTLNKNFIGMGYYG